MTHHLCTHSYNDNLFLPIWLKYHGEADLTLNLHVIITPSREGEVEEYRLRFPNVEFIVWVPDTKGDDNAMIEIVEALERDLFARGATLFGHLDADGYAIPANGDSLGTWIKQFMANPSKQVARAQGWEIVHKPDTEPPAFQDSDDLLAGRNSCYVSKPYSKPCFVKVQSTWERGFHKRCVSASDRCKKIDSDNVDPTLDLVHVALFDLQYTLDHFAMINSGRLGLHSNWTYTKGINEAGFRKFHNTFIAPWDQNNVNRASSRQMGVRPVKDIWRGKLLRT